MTAPDELVALDTSAAVPVLIATHDAHEAVAEWCRGRRLALADAGVLGGAAYDGAVALAAVEAGVPLGTRDARARSTHEALGARVLVVG